ncbi:pyrroline-5-carboxylate reductase [Alcaligenaceae bacterium LF4-65]|uniref:Pyrroline-5-carboxylate reductase n=1 Tax=Zwartia hollandica TaxID=324606 RepID=A0A953N7Z0_9BURK|nr:pyrroline-5-carboxylate reductase [Zwartia hollandica]MBZ1349238.1 pyrroline-5-carboxylate reductase [Zwartia hollandica]
MATFPSVAFIGGGNMANALVSGMLAQGCPAEKVHVIEVAEVLREQWRARSVSVSAAPDTLLSQRQVWIFAVKPQQMRDVVLQCRAWLQPNTLVISIAAGISIDSLGKWLGEDAKPFGNVVRCMPNTPALVGAGVTGMSAPATTSAADRERATALLSTVGEVVWVDNDKAIDAVTALSGSGPAYVFLFLESLIKGGLALGLSEQQARDLALSTLAGATKLAQQSAEAPSVLRERVTSKGGTTAAALDVFAQQAFGQTVVQAMAAADRRAAELSIEFGK